MNRVRPPRQNTDAELAAFEDTCERLGGFNLDINFEWADGFLTAVAASPRRLEADVWLPAMTGDAFDRAFADPPDRAQAMQSLQVRLDVLCDALDPEALLDDPDSLRLDPLMGEFTAEQRMQRAAELGPDTDEQAWLVTGVTWMGGLLYAVSALADDWRVPADEQARALFEQAFSHIAALGWAADSAEWQAHEATYYPSHPEGPPTRDDLLAEACMAVQDLRLLWVDFAPKPATRRVQAVPGRNDRCPCGSGKKFKKCHGAQA